MSSHSDARRDWENLVLDIAIECNVRDNRCLSSTFSKHLFSAERPSLVVLAKDERPSFVGSREYDDKGTNHILSTRSVLVRLEEVSFA